MACSAPRRVPSPRHIRCANLARQAATPLSTWVVAKHGARGDGRVEAGDLEAGVAGGRAIPTHSSKGGKHSRAMPGKVEISDRRRWNGSAAGTSTAARWTFQLQAAGMHVHAKLLTTCGATLSSHPPAHRCMLTSQGGGVPSLMPSASCSPALSTPAGNTGRQVAG